MEINKVIKQTARILQLSNVCDADFSNFENLDSQTQKDINLLLSCTNEVLSDIATDYLPLVFSETIEVTNGQFAFSNLSKPFHKLVSIETTNHYEIELETLYIKNGTYDIKYSYLPNEYSIGQSITEFGNRLTVHALSFGIAGEFCIVSGNYSESEMWNSRYENAMQIARRSLKTHELAKRRWL